MTVPAAATPPAAIAVESKPGRYTRPLNPRPAPAVRSVTQRASPGGRAVPAPVPADAADVEAARGWLAVRRSRRSTPVRLTPLLRFAFKEVHPAAPLIAVKIASATVDVALKPPATWPCRTLNTVLPFGRDQIRRT